MADTPALAPEYGYYQRLLARDQSEAADLIERTSKDRARVRSTTRCCCRRSTMRSATDWSTGCHSTRKRPSSMQRESCCWTRRRRSGRSSPRRPRHLKFRHLPPREPLRVLGCAINGAADELALMMLANLVDDLSIVVETTSLRMQASELVSLVEAQGVSVVCLADLPPSPPSKTRYLVKRLHAALPDLRILVGRWGPAALADESTQPLRDAGASLVASTLAETRTYLGGLAEIARIPAPVTTEA